MKSSSVENIPNVDIQKKIIDDLNMLTPKFVASGHGPCMKII